MLIISSLHEFSQPLEMLNEAGRVLVPGGRIGILEWRYEETENGPPLDHRLRPDDIDTWLANAGFEQMSGRAWSMGDDLYTATLADETGLAG